ncbi:MAG: CRISPR-associated protein [Selenomonadaceae bacterium]|nr:CRISPR-associated protein [Selenomonadaceae bacterium]
MTKSTLIGKIKITGKIILKSPLLISDGGGETAENFRDIHVLRNHDGKPFIPATSLCGVLRDWLESVEPQSVGKIFGDDQSMQSSIQLYDTVLEDGEIINRNGVRIDNLTGTGVDGGKYDYEAVERGATGNLQLFINLRGCHSIDEISETVALMLKKLSDGIRLGALTTKGFGLMIVENLEANLYDFSNSEDVAAWLLKREASRKILPATEKFSDSENNFVVDAEFMFNSSFIVRDYDAGDKNISAATLKSRDDFVIPGTSLKGILRHRAEYIFDKLGINKKFLEELMGTATSDKKIKSRFTVFESYVTQDNFVEFQNTRTKIDRFTGGTLQGTLFATRSVYQKNLSMPTLKIHFEIRDSEDYAAGLAIFLLRDLWLGRVAIGGEKSIGRGTLKGLYAEINFRGKKYKLDASGKVIDGSKEELENFAAALGNFLGGDG